MWWVVKGVQEDGVLDLLSESPQLLQVFDPRTGEMEERREHIRTRSDQVGLLKVTC
jgi:hypothetical protein